MSRWMDLMSVCRWRSQLGGLKTNAPLLRTESGGPVRKRCAISIDAHHAQIATMCSTVTLMVCKCGEHAALRRRGGTRKPTPGMNPAGPGRKSQRRHHFLGLWGLCACEMSILYRS